MSAPLLYVVDAQFVGVTMYTSTWILQLDVWRCIAKAFWVVGRNAKDP